MIRYSDPLSCGTQRSAFRTQAKPLVSATALLVLLTACGGSGGDGAESADDSGANASTSSPSTSTPVATGPRPGINSALIPAARSGSSSLDVVRTGELPYPDAGGVGAFRNVCQFSHMNFDDALLFPGQEGATHLHTYFGNTAARFDSTAESLRSQGASTCRGGTANRSAYWVPSMIDTRDGRPLAPDYIDVYYKTGYRGIPNSAIRPWPQGFRMIAGSASSGGAQRGVISYECNGGAEQDSIPNCTGTMTMSVTFPQCWDGVNLTSPDHKSHVAYPSGGRCPSSHPVPTPELSLHIHYNTSFGSSATWRLSSDMGSAPAGSSGHADWIHAWDNDVQETWVRQVVNRGLSGGSHILGDGRVMTCNFAGCR